MEKFCFHKAMGEKRQTIVYVNNLLSNITQGLRVWLKGDYIYIIYICIE